MKLTHTGSGYSGLDPETSQVVNAAPGETVEVSETKHFQLLTDFPGEWQELKSDPGDGIVKHGIEARVGSEHAAELGTKPRHTKPAKVAHTK